jgi:hypothetical protein
MDDWIVGDCQVGLPEIKSLHPRASNTAHVQVIARMFKPNLLPNSPVESVG